MNSKIRLLILILISLLFVISCARPDLQVKECAELCFEDGGSQSQALYDHCFSTCDQIKYYGGESGILKTISEYHYSIALKEEISAGKYDSEIEDCSMYEWSEVQCKKFLLEHGRDALIEKTNQLKKQQEDNTKVQEVFDYCYPLLLEAYTMKQQWNSFEYQHFGELQPQQLQQAETSAREDCQSRAESAVQYGNIEAVKKSIPFFLEDAKKEEQSLREAGRIK